MCCWLVFICLTSAVVCRKEVAVILGGGEQNVSVEVFTDRQDSCVETLQDWSLLFTYPGPLQHAAGVFLDNDGIYVCGGAGASQAYETACYYYDSPYRHWGKIDYDATTQVVTSGGIFDSAIVPWQDDGFIQVGGMDPDSLFPYNETYLYHLDDTRISEDLDKGLAWARAGHCFVRVKSSAGAGHGELYIVLGGIGDFTNSFLSYVHCKDLPCLDFQWKEAAVEELAPLNLINRDRHSCTVMTDGDQDLVLIVDRNVTYIMSHDCQEDTCSFALRNYHEMEVWEDFSITTTLDGVPFLFTERSVWRYLNPSWQFAGELGQRRTLPVILSVPEDWLCSGEISTTSTPPIVTTDPACPTVGECLQEDGRGESWAGVYWRWTRHPCAPGQQGEAWWFCDGCQGTFSGSQPDRLQCVEQWVRDLQLQIEDPLVTSTEISHNILNNIDNQTGPGLTGGSIVSLVGQYGAILEKRAREGLQEETSEFVTNMLAATSNVIELQVGWNEIAEEDIRYQSSSSILTLIDILGYQHIQERQSRRSQCSQEDEILKSDNIQLILHSGKKADSSLCFEFAFGGPAGRICIDQSSVEDDCPTYVSSQVSLDNEKSNLFPTQAGDYLGRNLIGLTVNNESLNIDTSQSAQIEITFFHDGSEVVVDWLIELSLSDCNISGGTGGTGGLLCLVGGGGAGLVPRWL